MRQRPHAPPGALPLAATGFTSIVAQTLILREVWVTCQGSELVTGLFLGSWLLWGVAGAVAGRTRLEHHVPSDLLRRLLAALLPCSLAQALAVPLVRVLLDVPAGALLPPGPLLLVTLVGTAPAALLTGFLFSQAATASEDGAGRAWAWETAGSCVGGLAFTVGLTLGVPPLALLGLAGAGTALVAWRAVPPAGRRVQLSIAVSALLSLALVGAGGPLERVLAEVAMDRLLPGASVIGTAELPGGRLAAARLPEQRVLVRDGAAVASWPSDAEDRARAALALAQAPGARRALLVGPAADPLATALLSWSSLESVELWPGDPGERAVAEAWFQGDLADPAGHARLVVRPGDPRSLLPSVPDDTFDLVLLEGGDPTTAAGNRLRTVEFHAEISRILTDRGLLATRVGSGANHIGDELADLGGSALATLEAVFPEVLVLPSGSEAVLLAAPTAGVLTSDGDLLAARLATLPPGPDGRPVVPPEAMAALVDGSRLATTRETYTRAATALGPDTDGHPRAFALALVVQARQAGGAGLDLLRRTQEAAPWTWWIPLLLFGLLRSRRVLATPTAAARDATTATTILTLAGFTAMAQGLVLLLAFQVTAGTLFGQVGLLNALLLGGLATGAAATARGRTPAGAGARLLLAAILANGALAGLLPPILDVLPRGPDAAPFFWILAVACGFVTGTLVGSAATLLPFDARAGATLLSADQLGAAAGALLPGLLVLPIAGTRGTETLLLGVQAVALGLLGARAVAGRGAQRMRRPASLPASSLTGEVALLAVVSLAFVSALAWHRADLPRTGLTAGELAVLSPGRTFLRVESPFLHHVASGAGAGEVAVASMAIRQDVQGWGGPLQLAVLLDPDGSYAAVQLLENHETPSYLGGIRTWLQGLQGRSARTTLALRADGGDVDGVSGATTTARAVLGTLNAVGNAVGRQILVLPTTATPPPPASPLGGLDAAATWLLVSIPLGIAALRWGGNRARLAVLVAAGVVGGPLLNAPFSLETLALPLQGRLPGPALSAPALLLAGVLLVTLVSGAGWCAQLCPLGAWLELLGRLGARLRRRFGILPSSPVAPSWAGHARFGLLALCIGAFSLTGERAFLALDPLGWAFSETPTGTAAWVLVLLLGSSLLVPRAWCRFLCPSGALLTLLARSLPRPGHTRFLATHPAEPDCARCHAAHVASCAASPDGCQPTAPRRTSLRWAATTGFPIVAILLALAWKLATDLETPAFPGSPGRTVDAERFRTLIEQGRLSDHAAEWWSPEAP